MPLFLALIIFLIGAGLFYKFWWPAWNSVETEAKLNEIEQTERDYELAEENKKKASKLAEKRKSLNKFQKS